MENKKIFAFSNSIFDNKNYFDKLKKSYLELSNGRIKKKQNINILTKTIKARYPSNSNSQQIDSLQKHEKNSGKEKKFNMISCPNKKYFKQIDLNQKYINIIQSKLFNPKRVKSIISTIKHNQFKNSINIKNEENNKLNVYNKENKLNKLFINHVKENQTFYAPFQINKNNSSKYYNKFNECLKVVPIIPEKTEGNIDTKKSVIKNKMRITSNNSWFRKTMVEKIKVPFLPRMKKLNEKIKKEKEKEKEKKKIKTFFHLTKNQGKQNISLNSFRKKLKHKQKNLSSFEIYSLPGTEKEQQKINQDTYLIFPNMNNTPNAKIFGVFDGHGINGDKLSQEIRDYFIEFFSDRNKYEKEILINSDERLSSDDNLEKIYKFISKQNFKEILEIYNDINKKLHNKYEKNNFCLKSGSTSNIIMILNDKKRQSLNKIISVNLGDSKSILINEENGIIELNKKHTPNDLEEKARIEKNGGEISRVDWADYGPLRIFYKNMRYPGLSMTRAFGDFNAEALGVNTIPDIKEYDIYDKKPKIIIIATNGIWQFLTNEQVKNIVLPFYEEDNISGGIQKLVSSARRMWETMNPKFIDDITVILLFFK